MTRSRIEAVADPLRARYLQPASVRKPTAPAHRSDCRGGVPAPPAFSVQAEAVGVQHCRKVLAEPGQRSGLQGRTEHAFV